MATLEATLGKAAAGAGQDANAGRLEGGREDVKPVFRLVQDARGSGFGSLGARDSSGSKRASLKKRKRARSRFRRFS